MKVYRVLDHSRMDRRPQRYGVEIEVENGSDCDWTDNSDWQRVHDGSLRNDGMEFITPPVEMRQLQSMVREYYEQHDNRGYEANIRTGIHVHADMTWRTIEQVAAICAVYAVVEPLMFELCGPEREECIYCVPWYRATDDADLMGNLLELDTPRRVRGHLEAACKYSALYIEPLRRLGTIEFRQAPTYASARELMVWAKAVEKIVTIGTYYGTPARVLEVAENNLQQIVQFVFKGMDMERAEQLIEECDSIGVAQRLVRTRQPSNWQHNMDNPLEQSGVYYQYAGNEGRRPLHVADPFEELLDSDEYRDDDDYDEQEDY